jgi:chromosomal replication initiator protein
MNPMLTLDRIRLRTAEHYDVPLHLMLGKSRQPRVAFPRQVSLYLARTKLGLTLEDIGAQAGVHHTTVLLSVRAVQNRITTEPQERERVEQLAVNITQAMEAKA